MLEESEVAALAFVDLRELKARFEQEIEVPLHWTSYPAAHTRVEPTPLPEMRARISTRTRSYTYMAPDPELCVPVEMCPPDREPIPPCDEGLWIDVDVALRTEHGELDLQLKGSGFARPPDPNNPTESDGFKPIFQVIRGDLRDARGTLQITADQEILGARFNLSIHFGGDPAETEGALWPQLTFEGTPERKDYEVPIWGSWPNPRSADSIPYAGPDPM